MADELTSDIDAYDVCGRFVVGFERGLCPEFQNKLEHRKANGSKCDLLIVRKNAGPRIETSSKEKLSFVDDDYLPIVVAMRPVADEMLVGTGSYEIVRQGGAYAVSPGRIECRGKLIDSWLEHGLFRPILNNHLASEGALLAHGGAVSYEGKVLLFLGESGKTSILLELMSRGAEYMADEYSLLDSDGNCTMYTPVMWMDDRHFIYFPELLEKCFPDRRTRKKVEKNISFFRMGYLTFRGDNFISRQARELLTTKCYFEGLTCRFDVPFPGSRSREKGKIEHVFHLEYRGKPGSVQPAQAHEIAQAEAAVMSIRQGHHSILAKLAGMRHTSLEELTSTYARAIGKAECHHMTASMRENRDRKSVRAIVDSILDEV